MVGLKEQQKIYSQILAENPSTRLMFLLDVVFYVQLWRLGEMINKRYQLADYAYLCLNNH
jgi:hypothetical protein